MLVAAEAVVKLSGWHRYVRGLRTDEWGKLKIQQDTVEQLKRATVVPMLLADRDFILDLLSRLSWVGTLLGAATYTAALAPPSGSNNVGFSVLNLLSFGFSLMLVVFVVACSIPSAGSHMCSTARPADAVLIWLSLLVASALLILAVMCGMLALLVGVWNAYGQEPCRWGYVFVPSLLPMVCTGLLCWLLLHRLWAVFPGWPAAAAACEWAVGSTRWKRLQRCWGRMCCWQPTKKVGNTALTGSNTEENAGQQPAALAV